MNKLAFMRLWDIYAGLLTSTQREMTDLYLNKDLTLTEIAEEKGVSRQAVSECLKNCKNQLQEFECKVGFLRILDENARQAAQRKSDAYSWAEDFKKSNPEFADKINALEKILNNDYSEEV